MEELKIYLYVEKFLHLMSKYMSFQACEYMRVDTFAEYKEEFLFVKSNIVVNRNVRHA